MTKPLHKIRIDAERLKDGPITHDIDVLPEDLGITEDPEYSFSDPVVGQVTASLAGNDLLLMGAISTIAKIPCGRCLEVVDFKLHAHLTLVYIQDPRLKQLDKYPDLDDGNSFWYDGDVVFPAEQFREQLLLQLPLKTSCELENDNFCPVRGVEVEPMVFGDESKFIAEIKEEDSSFAAQVKKLRPKIDKPE